jgi:putative alpha-1,2-mannosidase
MRPTSILLVLLALVTSVFAQTRDYTRWVNPFIGTGGHGHTFPGATMPFGMVQLSPDTRIDNWDGSSGYHYSDDIIYGFSHTHLSGTGIPDGCDILFMPTVGESPAAVWKGPKPSRFSHSNERSEPGFYSVKLDSGDILAEMTATKRVGFHRYTFPDAKRAIALDLSWRDQVINSNLRFAGKNRIEGFRQSNSWAKNQTVYFVAEFSESLDWFNVFSDELLIRVDEDGETTGKKLQALLGFSTRARKPVLVKVAISYVSIEGARKNLEAELPHWDFDKVRADARDAWNEELSKIEVSGGTDEQTTNFYSALYHTMIHPNVFNDVDGRYLGHDRKIHTIGNADALVRNEPVGRKTVTPQAASADEGVRVPGGVRAPGEQYTVFSLWDTFRAAHPLYTIIDQKRTVDYINSFIRIYEQGGRLPVWELWGEETDTMIGYHSVSVIADAMAKGIEGFDYEKAYKAAKHSANLDHHGLGAYKKRGYVSGEDDNESVSKTMEYAYNDYCIATMAQVLMLKKLKEPAKYKHLDDKQLDAEATNYLNRSLYYRNLFDPQTGFMRPKRNGSFIEPFAPNEITFHFTEGNSWQYSFFAPHDISELAELHGGKIKFAQKIDELFTTEQKLTGREQPDVTGLIGQYAHGNEPSHHMAYLYNYVNQPWKTQSYVRRIMDEFYKNAPDGLIGNEDAGQMSAWYVLSALGFYQVNPSRPVYDIGTPIFKEAKIRLENSKVVTIRAANVSDKNTYVASVKLNGAPYRDTQFQHRELMNGGTLEFVMTDQPTKNWFTDFSHSAVGGGFVQVPVIDGERTFRESTKVTIRPVAEGMEIFYSLDGSEPNTPYTAPFTLNATTEVKAVAVDERGRRSFVVEARMAKRPNDWTVKLITEFNSQYPGSSYDAIIDGLRGNHNFAAGEWQGYWGKPFEAVIDMQRETEIKEVGGSFLQSARSWIWMPDRLEFEVSSDGEKFTKIADWKPGFPQQEMNGTPKEFLRSITPVKARYVRVRAHNFGKIPSWHLGAGGDPWIFVDEIFIR